jgi:ABC-type bacteriocin/lantibiotic exporter with double-glycine peptidase domain
MLRQSIWADRETISPLERVFCPLVAALDPNCRIRGLYESLPDQSAALSTPDLLDTLANLGFTARTVRCRLSEVEPRVLPCLFIAEDDRLTEPSRPLAITELRRTGSTAEIDVFDGAGDTRRRITVGKGAEDPRGTLFVWQRFNEDRLGTSRFKRQSTGHTWFRAVVARFMGDFSSVFFLGLVINTVALATPLFIMLVYDRVVAARATETLPILLVGILGALAIEWKLRMTRSHAISWIASRIDWIVGTSIFGRLLNLPPAYVERASVAAQVARLKTFEAIRELFSGSVFFAVLEMPFVFVALCVIWLIAGPLVVVPLVMIVPYIALFIFARRKIMVSIRVAAKEISARQSFTIETLRRHESIRANGLTQKWLAKHRSLSGRENISRFHLNYLGTVAETVSQGLMSMAAIVTLSVGANLVWDGVVTTGSLVASMILVWRVLSPLYSLCTMIPRIEQVRNSVRQVNDLMDLKEETASDQSLPRIVRLKGMLEFNNVAFRYSAEADPVMDGLSFGTKPGGLVVISGNNGSGKSSILKLARGLYRAQSGTVRLDGFDIRQLDPQEIRRQVGYVPQSPDFFPGTIAENFRLVRPTATNDDIWSALKEIGADADIAALHDGLATPVSAVMSTSMRHKLNIARGVLMDPAILLMDEQPNSVLNGATGQSLKRFFANNRGRRTIVFVAGRADILRLADTVVLLRRYRQPVVGSPDLIFEYLKSGK